MVLLYIMAVLPKEWQLLCLRLPHWKQVHVIPLPFGLWKDFPTLHGQANKMVLVLADSKLPLLIVGLQIFSKACIISQITFKFCFSQDACFCANNAGAFAETVILELFKLVLHWMRFVTNLSYLLLTHRQEGISQYTDHSRTTSNQKSSPWLYHHVCYCSHSHTPS